jgi:hypothetical protein
MRSVLTQNCAAKRKAYRKNLAFAVANCSSIPASSIQIVQDSLERLDQVLVKMRNLICHALVSLKKLYAKNVFDMVSEYFILYSIINNERIARVCEILFKTAQQSQPANWTGSLYNQKNNTRDTQDE